MSCYIGQCFLVKAENTGGNMRFEFQLCDRSIKCYRDARSSFEFFCLPFERGNDTEVVEYAGPEFGGYLANRLDSGIEQAAGFFDAFFYYFRALHGGKFFPYP